MLCLWFSRQCYLEKGVVMAGVGQQDGACRTQVDRHLAEHDTPLHKLDMSRPQLWTFTRCTINIQTLLQLSVTG